MQLTGGRKMKSLRNSSVCFCSSKSPNSAIHTIIVHVHVYKDIRYMYTCIQYYVYKYAYMNMYVPCSAYEASFTAKSFEHCSWPSKIRCFNWRKYRYLQIKWLTFTWYYNMDLKHSLYMVYYSYDIYISNPAMYLLCNFKLQFGHIRDIVLYPKP